MTHLPARCLPFPGSCYTAPAKPLGIHCAVWIWIPDQAAAWIRGDFTPVGQAFLVQAIRP